MAGRDNRNKKITRIQPININLGLIIFGCLFVYIVVIVVSYFRTEHITPYEVTAGSLAINNTYKGLILREETVIDSSYSGYINYYARESEKVSNGTMVYTIDSTGKIAEMVNDNSGENSTLTDSDLEELKTQISSFSTTFEPSNFFETYNFKRDIEGTVLKLANYKVLSNIDKLSDKSIRDSISFGYSPGSGILVYSTDGYEDVTPDMVSPELMDESLYVKSQFHSGDLIAEGDPAYKLITSENWSVILEIDEERVAQFTESDYINVRFLKNNYTSWAQISILRQNGTVYLKLDFNNSMVTFSTDRFLEIELLGNTEEGLKIPKSAIVSRPFYLIPSKYLTQGGNTGESGFMKETFLDDGTASTEFVAATIYSMVDDEYYVDESLFNIGDYIIMPESTEKYAISKQGTLTGVYNINKGYADFKQITILNENEEYAIVKSNTEYGLSVYDHIVLKGDTVNENDFIFDMKKDDETEEGT